MGTFGMEWNSEDEYGLKKKNWEVRDDICKWPDASLLDFMKYGYHWKGIIENSMKNLLKNKKKRLQKLILS